MMRLDKANPSAVVTAADAPATCGKKFVPCTKKNQRNRKSVDTEIFKRQPAAESKAVGKIKTCFAKAADTGRPNPKPSDGQVPPLQSSQNVPVFQQS